MIILASNASLKNNGTLFLSVLSANFTTVEEWSESDEFINDVRENDTVTIQGDNLNDQTQLRFRCDASGNSDYVYINDVVISAKLVLQSRL